MFFHSWWGAGMRWKDGAAMLLCEWPEPDLQEACQYVGLHVELARGLAGASPRPHWHSSTQFDARGGEP
eukprot:4383416-Pyramimonas_sp.AAC.1